MTDALINLDPPSRRTVQAFVDASLELSAKGLQSLLTENCELEGVLTAGILRGRQVVQAHFHHMFKGVGSKGFTQHRRTIVDGRRIVLEWAILASGQAGVEPALGEYVLHLDESGLISSIRIKWDPKQVMGMRPRS